MSASAFRVQVAAFHRTPAVFWSSATNVQGIVTGLRNAQRGVDAEKERAWWDLQTRSREASAHARVVDGFCREAYELAGGDPQDLPSLTSIRVAQPLSFSSAPCAGCVALEDSFSPTDTQQREATDPWYDQYVTIFDDLVALIYKGTAAALWFDTQIAPLRAGMTGTNEVLAVKRWDVLVEGSRNMLYYGRNCFATSEVVGHQQFEDLPGSQRSRLEIETRQKFVTRNEGAYTAAGGIYTINPELLCPTCVPLVEPQPLGWTE